MSRHASNLPVATFLFHDNSILYHLGDRSILNLPASRSVYVRMLRHHDMYFNDDVIDVFGCP